MRGGARAGVKGFCCAIVLNQFWHVMRYWMRCCAVEGTGFDDQCVLRAGGICSCGQKKCRAVPPRHGKKIV